MGITVIVTYRLPLILRSTDGNLKALLFNKVSTFAKELNGVVCPRYVYCELRSDRSCLSLSLLAHLTTSYVCLQLMLPRQRQIVYNKIYQSKESTHAATFARPAATCTIPKSSTDSRSLEYKPRLTVQTEVETKMGRLLSFRVKPLLQRTIAYTIRPSKHPINKRQMSHERWDISHNPPIDCPGGH